ncbi:MAG: hypothetical protein Q8P18_01570 [Pseudomonadota bacterium]|nr:hypothetical protein [Pseudomonadota bacterium]
MIDLGLQHLGQSGLRLRMGGGTLAVDAPTAVDTPLVVTWTERERVAGALAGKGALAAAPRVLGWLGRAGTVIGEGWPTSFHGFLLRARPFTPIPYATAPEALRKVWSAVRAPPRAIGRVVFTLGRPETPPLALTIEREGCRVALISQALHRFLRPHDLAALAGWAGHLDLVVAGTDYDDEAATGAMIGAFDARVRVIADLTGSIRRTLGLPVRPLSVALAAAPPGTRLLEAGDGLEVEAT